MFLDFMMLELDGFEILEVMGKKGYMMFVVVVLGDI